MPERIIAEKTGHKSLSGLCAYEHTYLTTGVSLSKSLAAEGTFFCMDDSEHCGQSSAPVLEPGETETAASICVVNLKAQHFC